VVAVHRALAVVERALDPRPGHELLAHLPHLAARRVEERQRRAGPDEHANGDPLGKLGQQLPQDDVVPEPEARREEPAREVDVRFGATELVGDPWQRLLAVDQHLEPAALARRRIARRPEAVV
jgi:hypothetical protein